MTGRAENTLPKSVSWPGEDLPAGRRLTFLRLVEDADLKWYVARSATRREKVAEASLIEAGLVVYLPRLTRWRRHAGKKHKVDQPLLGGYLFVGVRPDERGRAEDLQRVIAADGVHALVRVRQGLPPMPVAFSGHYAGRGDDRTYFPGILDILEQELAGVFDNTGKRRNKDPEAGSVLKIIGGKFQGFPARFVERTEDDRVKVMFQMFGKESPMTLEPDQLQGLDPDE